MLWLKKHRPATYSITARLENSFQRQVATFVKAKLECRCFTSDNYTHGSEVRAFAFVGVEEFGYPSWLSRIPSPY